MDGGDKVYIDSNVQITGVTTASAIDATTVTASTLRTGTDATTSIAIDNNSIKGPAEILIDPILMIMLMEMLEFVEIYMFKISMLKVKN